MFVYTDYLFNGCKLFEIFMFHWSSLNYLHVKLLVGDSKIVCHNVEFQNYIKLL